MNQNTTHMNMKKVFIYCRKSQESEERQALSIPSQIAEMNKVAKRDNLTIEKTFEESQSAKKPGRPVFEEMLIELEKQSIKKILVWNPDRLSRNSVDTGKIIYMMDQGFIDEIITPNQSFQATPNDKFLFNILCGQAKLENDNRGINAKRGMSTKAEMGWYPAPAPLGYKNTPDRKKGFKVIIKDDNFELVKKCFQEVLKGKQPVRVWELASKEWGVSAKHGKPIAPSTFYRLITSPFYYGEFEWPSKSGKWFQGKHEPMITRDEFDRIQQLLGSKGRPVARSHTFDLTGLFRCSVCGCGITASKKTKYFKKTDRWAEYSYYHCSRKNRKMKCTQPPIKQSDFEVEIMKQLILLKPPEDFVVWAKKWIKVIHDDESSAQEEILSSKHRALETVEKQLNNLLKMRINDDIDDEKYRETKTELESNRDKLKKSLETIDERMTTWRFKVERAIDIAYGAYLKFKTGKRDVRHEVLLSIGSNLKLDHKEMRILLDDHFQTFAEQEKWPEKFKDWVEPQKYTDLFEKRPDLRPAIPIWLEDRNVNITSQFVRIFKVFEDFRFIQQLREDMDKVRPAVAIAV